MSAITVLAPATLEITTSANKALSPERVVTRGRVSYRAPSCEPGGGNEAACHGKRQGE